MKKRDFFKTGILGIGAMLLSRKSMALEYYPTTNNVDWAVLYGTWCGSSRDAAVWITEGMDGIADVFDVRENPDLSKYKHIIVGGSIRSGVTPKELQDFLTKNNATLKGKVRGQFAVCGNMKQPVTKDLYGRLFDNHLTKLTGAAGVPQRVFLGRITWGLMEPTVRDQMKAMPGMDEYDNLKRSECMEFGREILKSIQ
jgi:hypothetical protein